MAKKKEKKEKKAGKRMYIFGIASHYPSAKNVMRRYIT